MWKYTVYIYVCVCVCWCVRFYGCTCTLCIQARVFGSMYICVCLSVCVCRWCTWTQGHMCSSCLPVDWLTCRSRERADLTDLLYGDPHKMRKQAGPRPATAGFCWFLSYNFYSNFFSSIVRHICSLYSVYIQETSKAGGKVPLKELSWLAEWLGWPDMNLRWCL